MPRGDSPNKTRRWPRALAGIGLVFLLLLSGLYLLSGRLISVVVTHIANSEGFELREREIGRPGTRHWSIPRINGRSDQLMWSVSNAQLNYHWWELLRGELRSVVVESIQIRFDPAATAASNSNDSSDSTLAKLRDHLAPEYWLQRLPWRALEVGAITLDLPARQTKLSGDLRQDQNDVRFYSHIENAELNLEHDLVLMYSRAQGLTIDLSRADASKESPASLLSVSSQFNSDSLDLSLQAHLADEDAQEFANIIGRPDVTFNMLGAASTSLPWPVPEEFGWEQLNATGSYSLSILAPEPVLTEPQSSNALKDLKLTNFSGNFGLRDESLELQLVDGVFSVAQEGTSSKATCSVQAAVTVTVAATRWAMSDGISCVLEGAELLQLNLRELTYRNQQDAQAIASQELRAQLDYAGTFHPLGKPLTANGELELAIQQTGVDQVTGTGTVRVQSPLLLDPAAKDRQSSTTLPFRFDYQPERRRGRAQFEHSIQLGERVLAKTVLDWQDNIDVSGVQLHYMAEVDWHENDYSARLRGEFSAASVVNPPDAPASTLQLRPLSGVYTLLLNNESVTTTGAVSLSGLEFPYEFDYSSQTGVGRLRSTFAGSVPDAVFSKVFRNWTEPYDLVAGQFSGELESSFTQESSVRTTASTTLSDAILSYEDSTVNGMAGDFEVEMTSDLLVVTSTNLRANTLDIGFPITDMKAGLYFEDRADNQNLRLDDTGASLLGGWASVPVIHVDLTNLTSQFELQLADLSLAQILALEGESIRGNGIVSGTLPVHILDGEVRIREGTLASLPPGGEIKLSDDFSSLTGQPGLDFALQALNDFSYDSLLADVSYAPDGNLELGVALQGSNPAIEQGRRIHYNVTVSENVLALLESLQADRIITDKIEQRVNQPEI